MAATEDEVAAQAAAAKTASVRSFTRKRPVRKPWPEDVERKRVVIDPSSSVSVTSSPSLESRDPPQHAQVPGRSRAGLS